MAQKSAKEILGDAFSIYGSVHNTIRDDLLENYDIIPDNRSQISPILDRLEGDSESALREITQIREAGERDIFIDVDLDDFGALMYVIVGVEKDSAGLYHCSIDSIEALICDLCSSIEAFRADLYYPDEKHCFELLENSIHYIKKAIEVQPKNKQGERNLVAMFYDTLGQLHHRKGEIELAKDAYEKVLEFSDEEHDKLRSSATENIKKIVNGTAEKVLVDQKHFKMADQKTKEMLEVVYSIQMDIADGLERISKGIKIIETEFQDEIGIWVDDYKRKEFLNEIKKLQNNINIGLQKIEGIKIVQGSDEVYIKHENYYVSASFLEVKMYHAYAILEKYKRYGYFVNQGEYWRTLERSIEYNEKAIEVCIEYRTDNKNYIGILYNYLGDSYVKKHEADLALQSFEKSLEFLGTEEKDLRIDGNKMIEKIKAGQIANKHFYGSGKTVGCLGIIAIISFLAVFAGDARGLVGFLIFGGIAVLYYIMKRK